MVGYYNYTVVLTYIGMLVGFGGIVYAMNGDVWAATVCLLVAGVCDMFDGAIASTRKRTEDEKCFGIQIDSLSDLICFGVLPAAMLCMIGKGNYISYAVSALYVLSALIRLAYYNVDEQNRQRVQSERRKYNRGLPVTTIVVVFPAFLAFGGMLGLKKSLTATVTLAITGVLFLTPFKIKKPQVIGKILLAICGILEFAFFFSGMGDI